MNVSSLFFTWEGECLKSRWRWRDVLWYALGCAVYAAAVKMLIVPHEITPGGFTGLAALIALLTNIPVGIAVLLLNLPILWLGYRRFGFLFIAKTGIATLLLSVMLTLADRLPPLGINQGLAAVFGGLAMGLGLSTVLLHGATTGGVDIVAKLTHERFPHLTVGRLILGVDAVVVALTAAVYGNLESALYSIVALYASSRVTDLILYGADRGRLILAITKKPDAICDAIHTELHRGVTKTAVTGSYSDEEYTLLICTVRNHEIAGIYRIIAQNDPQAFLMIAEVGEVLGKGFKAVQ